MNQTSLRLRSTFTDGAKAYFCAAYPQATDMAREASLLEQRIQWLAMFCNLSHCAVRAVRLLSEREAGLPLGKLVDRLSVPAWEVAQLATPHSPLREWGLVRITVDPEPSLKLTERTWRFLHAEAPVMICDISPQSLTR